jgi:UDP-glucose 4-epimerase/UDP-glucuronate decarboxylase
MPKSAAAKRILITGGAGFVGYHLARRLAGAKHSITIADNFFRGRRDQDFDKLLSLPNVRLVEGDLSRQESWESLDGGFDDVYHLAGINGTRLFYEMPHEVLRIGVSSTLYALEWFRSHNKVAGAKILYASSNEAYAGALEAFGTLPLPTPEAVPLVVADTHNPRWSYAGQKLIGELLFISYARAYGLRMAIVRPHNFYGPRAGDEHVIPQIIARIRERTDPFPLFGADHMRSFCYIEDAVEAMQRVTDSDFTDGGTYHIGSREELSVKALAEQIFSAAGWQPRDLALKDSPQGSVKRRLPDVSKIKQHTGWEATTSLEAGLRKTIDWYLAQPPQRHR